MGEEWNEEEEVQIPKQTQILRNLTSLTQSKSTRLSRKVKSLLIILALTDGSDKSLVAVTVAR